MTIPLELFVVLVCLIAGPAIALWFRVEAVAATARNARRIAADAERIADRLADKVDGYLDSEGEDVPGLSERMDDAEEAIGSIAETATGARTLAVLTSGQLKGIPGRIDRIEERVVEESKRLDEATNATRKSFAFALDEGLGAAFDEVRGKLAAVDTAQERMDGHCRRLDVVESRLDLLHHASDTVRKGLLEASGYVESQASTVDPDAETETDIRFKPDLPEPTFRPASLFVPVEAKPTTIEYGPVEKVERQIDDAGPAAYHPTDGTLLPHYAAALSRAKARQKEINGAVDLRNLPRRMFDESGTLTVDAQAIVDRQRGKRNVSIPNVTVPVTEEEERRTVELEPLVASVTAPTAYGGHE